MGVVVGEVEAPKTKKKKFVERRSLEVSFDPRVAVKKPESRRLKPEFSAVERDRLRVVVSDVVEEVVVVGDLVAKVTAAISTEMAMWPVLRLNEIFCVDVEKVPVRVAIRADEEKHGIELSFFVQKSAK